MLIFPDFLTPAIKGREAAIAANWNDLDQYNKNVNQRLTNQQLEMENQLFQDTYDERRRRYGVDLDQVLANTDNTRARTGSQLMQTEFDKATFDSRVRQAAAEVDRILAGIDQTKSMTDRANWDTFAARSKFPGELEQQGVSVRTATAAAEAQERSNTRDKMTFDTGVAKDNAQNIAATEAARRSGIFSDWDQYQRIRELYQTSYNQVLDEMFRTIPPAERAILLAKTEPEQATALLAAQDAGISQERLLELRNLRERQGPDTYEKQARAITRRRMEQSGLAVPSWRESDIPTVPGAPLTSAEISKLSAILNPVLRGWLIRKFNAPIRNATDNFSDIFTGPTAETNIKNAESAALNYRVDPNLVRTRPTVPSQDAINAELFARILSPSQSALTSASPEALLAYRLFNGDNPYVYKGE